MMMGGDILWFSIKATLSTVLMVAFVLFLGRLVGYLFSSETANDLREYGCENPTWADVFSTSFGGARVWLFERRTILVVLFVSILWCAFRAFWPVYDPLTGAAYSPLQVMLQANPFTMVPPVLMAWRWSFFTSLVLLLVTAMAYRKES